MALAKEIIQKCNLNVKVERLTDCNDEFFVLLYKGLIGDNIKGISLKSCYSINSVQAIFLFQS